MRSIQPLFPVSCILLTETAMVGIIIAIIPTKAIREGKSASSPASIRIIPPIIAKICKTVAMTKYPRYDHQYSDLDALPEKVAYLFLNTVVSASMKPIICCGLGLNAGAPNCCACGCPSCSMTNLESQYA